MSNDGSGVEACDFGCEKEATSTTPDARPVCDEHAKEILDGHYARGIGRKVQSALEEAREVDDPDDPYQEGVNDGYTLALAWVAGLLTPPDKTDTGRGDDGTV